MTVTYDITNDIGKLRLNIADVDITTAIGDRDDWTCLFTDEELQIFLDRASSDLNMSAYYALMSVAANRALLARKRKLGDFEEDMSKVADEVRKQALAYRDQSEREPAVGWAEQSVTDFAFRDIVRNTDLRSG